MTDENTWWKNLKDTRWYYIIAVACASGVYFGNIINIFYGLIYMQASALAGASIFPAIVGGIVGLTAYRIFFKFHSFSIVLAIALGTATYAIIGSFLAQRTRIDCGSLHSHNLSLFVSSYFSHLS